MVNHTCCGMNGRWARYAVVVLVIERGKETCEEQSVGENVVPWIDSTIYSLKGKLTVLPF